MVLQIEQRKRLLQLSIKPDLSPGVIQTSVFMLYYSYNSRLANSCKIPEKPYISTVIAFVNVFME